MAEPGPTRQRQADLAVTSIRRAHPADAGRLTEIALAAKASWGYSPSFMARCRSALAVDSRSLGECQFHLAEGEDGTILGFYGFAADPEGIELSHLFVAPEAIGRGIGRALWRHAVALARQLGETRLLVVSDPHAAGFYARMGAEPAGSRASEIDPARLLPIYRLRLDRSRDTAAHRPSAAKEA
jgi:GNAT superfamily N-acetyltransferase